MGNRKRWNGIILGIVLSAGIVFGAQVRGQGDSVSPAVADTPPRGVDFSSWVRPWMAARGCHAAQCHGATQPTGNLPLSLFAADAGGDYQALVRADKGRYIDPVAPDESLLLLKITGQLSHKGGAIIRKDSSEYAALRAWIAAGAPYRLPSSPELERLEIVGAETLRWDKGHSETLKATVVYSDGSKRDVTETVRWAVSDPAVAKIEADGRLTAVGHGQATITAGYLGRQALVTLVVPQPLAKPFPQIEPANRVDALVLAKLRQWGVPPSEVCSDAVFLRRVYLDVTGTLPTIEQARAFLADKSPDKRATLIDRLLDSEEFADYWALRWGDLLRIKSEYPSNLWPNAVQAYHHWIRDSIRRNKPYDRFARELLVSSGSNFRDPAVNFYRAFPKRTPENLADATALVFMGARLGCARCHAHPQEAWTPQTQRRLAAFFAGVAYKKTDEWKEEIVYARTDAVLRDPRTGQVVKPAVPGGEPITIEPGADPRVAFAEWLTAPDNPWFARAIVNRVWFWLMGRGLVDPVDDLRPSNPPIHPELLDYLAGQLVEHQYDLKHVYRLILNSRTYQTSSQATALNAHDRSGLSHYLPRRLTAEVLLDAIGQVTGTTASYSSRIPEPFTFLPKDTRAIHVDDASITTPFLELFGRPSRDSAYASERDDRASMRQALYVLNSGDVQSRIASGPVIRQWVRSKKSREQLTSEIYLATLSRYPKPAEKATLTAYLDKAAGGKTQAVQDVVWAVLNTKEFLYNH